MNEAAVMAVLGVVVLVYLVLIGISIASYVMNGVAFYTLAKRRDIPNPWLAWIPVAKNWVIGSIARDYDSRNGQNRRWDIALLTLSVISAIGFVVYLVCIVAFGVVMEGMKYGVDAEEMVEAMIVLYGVVLVWALAAVAFQALHNICLYKIFESTMPKKAITYLLLNLLVPLAGPICLIKCKDKGYPEPMIIKTAEVMEEEPPAAEIAEPEPVETEN